MHSWRETSCTGEAAILNDLHARREGNDAGSTATIDLLSPSTAQTPEPSSLLLLATGLLGFAHCGKRRSA